MLDLSIFACSFFPFFNLVRRRGTRPDVIIAVSPPLLFGVWPMLTSFIFGTPWVYHIQDFQVDAAARLGMLRSPWFNRLLLRLEGQFIRSATRVSSISPAMLRRAQSKGASTDRKFSLPNWTDVTSIRPLIGRSSFRGLLNLGPGQLVIMYAGAMGKKQGLSLILDAAKQLSEDRRFRFVMIGAGADAETLRARAQARGLSNVAFFSPRPTEALNDLLNAADVHLVVQKSGAADLVMPSKLTNALASGRPVLVTANSGTDLYNVVIDAQCGLVVRPDNLDAIVSALEHLADNEAERREMGRNARRYAEKYLDQNHILARFDRELSQLLSASSPQIKARTYLVSGAGRPATPEPGSNTVLDQKPTDAVTELRSLAWNHVSRTEPEISNVGMDKPAIIMTRNDASPNEGRHCG